MIKKWFLVLILKYRTKFHLSLGEHMGKDLSFVFEKKPMQWGLRVILIYGMKCKNHV